LRAEVPEIERQCRKAAAQQGNLQRTTARAVRMSSNGKEKFMPPHDTPKYSPYFHCLYDEPVAMGSIGRGTHYSVVQALSWHSSKGELRKHATTQNVAIIWDEDHDLRIIPCMERLLRAGLLHAISMIGERKGGVTIVFNTMFAAHMNEGQKHTCREEITKVINDVIATESRDSWSITFGEMTETPSLKKTGCQTFHQYLIQDSADRIETYIRNINNLWDIDSSSA
jgi:hypothetical protein